ncbi:hypothetical protein ACFVHW_04355 [Streptomyces sp. NPDC127110]|uniref:hypothetical protein n=1 Tax=Streptomyces sp. NPDC127110 TaxID=3345362 RepID=UPI0036259E37
MAPITTRQTTKRYRRTENGVTTYLSREEGAAEIERLREAYAQGTIRELFAGPRGATYTNADGLRIHLYLENAPKTRSVTAKVYERTENGTATTVDRRTGLDEINAAMMGETKGAVREMSQITRTDYAIEYTDGRSVRLVLVDAQAEETPALEPERTPLGYVVVTAGNRQFAVWPHISRKHPKNQYGVSCTADHTTYHGYRNGERFGPARHTSEASTPGTIGALIWAELSK